MMEPRAAATAAATSKPTPARKRKLGEHVPTPNPKSAKSSRSSTPATSARGRKINRHKTYAEANSSDEDALSDDEFEKKLAAEMTEHGEEVASEGSQEEIERALTLELASEYVILL